MEFIKKYITLPFYFLTLLMASFLWRNEWLCFVVVGSISLIFLLFVKRTRKDKIVFIVFTILGFIIETTCIYMGAWSYANHSIMLVPVWLPLTWGIIGLFFEDGHKILDNIK